MSRRCRTNSFPARHPRCFSHTRDGYRHCMPWPPPGSPSEPIGYIPSLRSLPGDIPTAAQAPPGAVPPVSAVNRSGPIPDSRSGSQFPPGATWLPHSGYFFLSTGYTGTPYMPRQSVLSGALLPRSIHRNKTRSGISSGSPLSPGRCRPA